MTSHDFEQLTVLEAILHYETLIKPLKISDSHTMKTKEGEITLLDGETNELVLYRIFLYSSCQRKGILTNLIKYFQEHTNYRKICICAADGPVESCLRKINYMGRCFINHGGDLIWTREGSYCKCHDVDQVTKRLIKKS